MILLLLFFVCGINETFGHEVLHVSFVCFALLETMVIGGEDVSDEENRRLLGLLEIVTFED